MKETILEIQNLNFSTSGEQILKDINLKIIKDTFAIVVGSSGSGKSTLLKVMAGLQVPDNGKIIIDNCDISNFGYEEMIPIRKKISFAFQDAALISNLSIKENLILGLDFYFTNYTKKDKEDKVKKILDKMMILHTLDTRPGNIFR